jgi:hypothetical protein
VRSDDALVPTGKTGHLDEEVAQVVIEVLDGRVTPNHRQILGASVLYVHTVGTHITKVFHVKLRS